MSRIPSSFDLKGPELEIEEMNFWQKVVYHCKQQPFVPIGALLTTGAVILAAQNIRIGNRQKAQYYFRWRVGLQGATLIALVAGSFIYGTSKKNLKSREDQLREKAKQRESLWVQELERKDAEVQQRKLRAEKAREKTAENEDSIKQLEAELKDLESKLIGASK